MIEIYLFVNPLGSFCLKAEKDILKLVETKKQKIHFRFIPLVNMKMINYILNIYNIHIDSVEKRNTFFKNSYSAALDYKAAQLQGKKKGRYVLMKLQETVTQKNIAYSHQLAEQFITDIDGDVDMFRFDRQSNSVVDSFHTDQKIAREMGVVTPPSAVIFNYTCNLDYGVLVENCHSIKEIEKLCQSPQENRTYDMTNSIEPKLTKQAHLHLL